MSCPFLKEGRAQYCHAAPVSKLILEGPGFSGAGRCASPEYYIGANWLAKTNLASRAAHTWKKCTCNIAGSQLPQS